MTRDLRRATDSTWHHIMNQGVRRYPIYRADGDRLRFLGDLRTASEKHDAGVAAYCLMGNHYHLVMHGASEAISATMQQFGTRYVRWFNRRYGYVGPLFRARFASVAIDCDEQLVSVLRYVHRNPLELGYDIATYPWSTHAHYLGGRRESWLDDRLTRRLLGSAKDYGSFVKRPMPADRFSLTDGARTYHRRQLAVPDVGSIRQTIADATSEASDRDRRIVAALVFAEWSESISLDEARSLGFPTVGAYRSAVSRARRRMEQDQRLVRLLDAARRVLLDRAA
ncbi:MAG: transposase [Actinomycetota bacterium]